MIFEKEFLSLQVIDVIALSQRDVRMYNSGRDFSAISLRLASDATLETEDQSCRLGPDVVTFVPAGVDYTRNATVDEMIVVNLKVTDYSSSRIEFFHTEHPEAFHRLFREILAAWEGRERGYLHRCTALLYRIFEECFRQNEMPEAAKAPSKIQGGVDYLHENYRRADLTVAELARRSFMSEVYFRRLFKREYGVSPQKFILSLRQDHAQGLIRTGYYSLKEVALLSGYSDYKYFSTEFKRRNGVSPSKYLQAPSGTTASAESEAAWEDA